jgi:hypothetical protein
MIKIFKIEVSTNGRDHIIKVDETDIRVKDRAAMAKERESLKKKYSEELGIEDVVLYFSFEEK